MTHTIYKDSMDVKKPEILADRINFIIT